MILGNSRPNFSQKWVQPADQERLRAFVSWCIAVCSKLLALLTQISARQGMKTKIFSVGLAPQVFGWA
jgi:hypothetical protein